MKVLLLEFVRNVGRAGEIKEVADGLALNQLIPRNKAVPATPDVIARHRREQQERERKESEAKAAFMNAIELLKEKQLIFHARTNGKGALYQSVTPALIRNFLRDQYGVIVPEQAIREKPLRTTGTHAVRLEAYGITHTITLVIEPQ